MKGIYLIENTKFNDKYIGSTFKIHNRWNTHTRLLLNNKHHCTKLQESFNKTDLCYFKFSILEIIDQNISEKELQFKESEWSNKLGNFINRLPVMYDGRSNFSHKRETVLNILKTQKRYKPFYALNNTGEIVGEYELLKDVKEHLNIGVSSVKESLLYKKYTRKGYVFVYKNEYSSNIKFTFPNLGNKGISKPFKGETREVIVSTLYGDYFATFKDLHKCAKYFNTAPANIHRKMNVLKNKKNLIDSELSKYILTDKETDISHIKTYWYNIIEQFKNSSGEYKIFDCYNNLIGMSNAKSIKKILSTTSSINYNIKRGTYFKTFKFVK
jgi:hypothetical protein